MKFSLNPFSGPNPKRLDKCAPKCKIILNIYLLTEKRIQFWISKFSKGVGQWASEWPNKSWQSQSQNNLLQNTFKFIFCSCWMGPSSWSASAPSWHICMMPSMGWWRNVSTIILSLSRWEYHKFLCKSNLHSIFWALW